MKVLANALLLNDNFSGVQYSTENLLKAISNSENTRFAITGLFSNNYSGDLIDTPTFHMERVNFDTKRRLRRIYYEHFRLPKFFSENAFDLYHSTGYVLPFFPKMPSVLTVHDLIALNFPGYCQNETAIYYGLFLPKSIYKANRIIAVSNKIKSDIIKMFGISASKIDVVYHGIDREFKKVWDIGKLQQVAVKYSLPEKFILFVGNLEPKKNLSRLIDAFIDLKINAHIEHKLVIVGKDGWKYGEIYKKIKTLNADSDIIITGYVEKKDIPAIYSLSDLFVFVSLYEGFGLPVLEAMACETPVLISNQGALPEIAGDWCPSANPFDTKDISAKIHAFLTDSSLRSKSIAYGINRSKLFNWDKSGRETLQVYDKAYSQIEKFQKQSV